MKKELLLSVPLLAFVALATTSLKADISNETLDLLTDFINVQNETKRVLETPTQFPLENAQGELHALKVNLDRLVKDYGRKAVGEEFRKSRYTLYGVESTIKNLQAKVSAAFRRLR